MLRRFADEGRAARVAVQTSPSEEGRAAAQSLGLTVRGVADGEVLAIEGPRRMRLRCCRENGLSALVDEASKAAFTGAALGPVPVANENEGARDALLGRLAGAGVRTLYPAYGWVVPDGAALLQQVAAANT